MRFREFKILLEDKQKMYAIGDSHAVAIGNRPGWISLATNGRSAMSPDNDAAISKVDPGSLVVLSAGANDMLNSNKQAVANRIDSMIEKLQAKKCKVYYVLFAETDNPKYAKDRNQLRDLVSSTIGSGVSTLDMGALSVKNGDGIHAPMSWYASAAAKAAQGAGTGPMPSNQAANEPTKGDAQTITQLAIPRGIRGPEIADIQKTLKAIGYGEMLGNFGDGGVDGIRGKYTTRAIRAFQVNNGLRNTSGVPDEETIEKLNSLIKSDPKLQNITKSTEKDVRSSVSRFEMKPLAQDAVTKGKVGKVLNLIAGPESGGHYDIMMGGRRDPSILRMTLSELLQYQRRYKAAGAETAAAGRYQYMPNTLRDYARRMGVDMDKQTFDPKFQDELAIYTMRYQCRLDDWLAGTVSDGSFLNLLAQVWAGIPKTSGFSAYQNVGSNKAGIKVNVALNTLQDIRTA